MSSERRTIPVRNVFLHVTKTCNLECSYCYFSAPRSLSDEMTTAEFARLWPDVSELAPEKVIFTGGEPLLREDLLDLLRGLRDCDPEHRIRRCLNTNGHLVTPDVVWGLRGLADEVRVSLDAMKETDDELRGAGNFDAAVEAIRCFRDGGFDPKVLVTVTAKNLPDLPTLIGFLVNEGVTQIKINEFRAIGRGARWHGWEVATDVLRGAVSNAFRSVFADIPSASEPPQTRHQSNCGIGMFINLMPNGDVFPCHVLIQPEFYCGNVRKRSLLEICESHGKLGSLGGMRFEELVDRDPSLESLTDAGTCFGSVYTETRHRPVWNALSFVHISSARSSRGTPKSLSPAMQPMGKMRPQPRH